MRSLFPRLLALGLASVVSAFCTTMLHAQQYVYTNNNVAGQTNSTTALRMNSAGALKVIKTYSTGGKSTGGSGYFALSPIASAKTSLGSCLFVSNGGDSTIAAFQVNLFNGTLQAVSGSPFSYGVSGAQKFGIGLAVGNNRLLFAGTGNTSDNTVSVLKISQTCGLKGVITYRVPGSLDGMKVTLDGKYLIATYLGPVDSFQIDYTKAALKEIGPFAPQGTAAGVEISCDSSTAYFGDSAAHTQVEVFSINSATGVLSEINNFTNSHGSNSNNLMLSKDGQELYVSNTQSNEITVLSVGSNGALTYDNTTKLKNPGMFALGLGSSRTGANIFVSEEKNPEAIGVFAASGTTITEVAGSPFKVIKNGSAPAALITLPPKPCH